MLLRCGLQAVEPRLVLFMLSYCQLEAAPLSLTSFLPHTPMLPLMCEKDGWISK